MKEEWRPVKGFEKYAEISNLGQIHRFEKVWYSGRGHKAKRIQEEDWTYGYVSSKGYLYARIGGVNKGVHVWVYMTFVGDIPEGLEVNHIDEDKHNNRLDNLNLLTRKENNNWGHHNERVAAALTNSPKISKAVQALDKITGEVVYEFPSTREAEREYGFNHENIAKCCRGECKTAYGFIWCYAV